MCISELQPDPKNSSMVSVEFRRQARCDAEDTGARWESEQQREEWISEHAQIFEELYWQKHRRAQAWKIADNLLKLVLFVILLWGGIAAGDWFALHGDNEDLRIVPFVFAFFGGVIAFWNK